MGEFKRDRQTGRYNRRDSPRDRPGSHANRFRPKGFNSDSRKSGFSRGREKRPNVKVTCSKCGKECEVPFKPTGKQPVYCRECFKKPDNNSFGDSENRFDRRESENRFERRESGNRFERSDNGSDISGKIDELNQRFDEVDRKLERIMNLLGINHK